MRERRHLIFSEKNVRALQPHRKQYVVWDAGNGRGAGEVARGLHILISPMGAKSYRSIFYFNSNPKAYPRHLGRVGEMPLTEARELCRQDRANARKEPPLDPRA